MHHSIKEKHPGSYLLTIYSYKGTPHLYAPQTGPPYILFTFIIISFGLDRSTALPISPLKIVYIIGIITLALSVGYFFWYFDHKENKKTRFNIDVDKKSISVMHFTHKTVNGVKKIVLTRTPYQKRNLKFPLFNWFNLEGTRKVNDFEETSKYSYYFRWELNVVDNNNMISTIFSLSSKSPLKYYKGFKNVSETIAEILDVPYIESISKTKIVYEKNNIRVIPAPNSLFNENSKYSYSYNIINELEYQVGNIKIKKKEDEKSRKLTLIAPFSFTRFFFSGILIPYIITISLYSLYILIIVIIASVNNTVLLSSIILLFSFLFSTPFLYTAFFFNNRVVLNLDKKNGALIISQYNIWIEKTIFSAKDIISIDLEFIDAFNSFLEIIYKNGRTIINYEFQDPKTNSSVLEEIRSFCMI